MKIAEKKEKYEKLSRISNSFDTVAKTATSSTSVLLPVTGNGLKVIPLSAGIASGVTICKKLFN